jgi:curli biogenesis system outer membrane secretion channel CsgG
MRRWLSVVTIAVLAGVLVPTLLWAADQANPAAQAPGPQERVLKKRIAVLPTEVQIEQWDWEFGQTSLASGLGEMMTTALVNTGRFIVVERAELDAALAEMQLTEQGVTTQETGAQAGQAIGAEFLAKGTITEFEYAKSGGGGGISIGGVSVGGGKSKALIGLDIRVFHSSTTEVVAADHVQGKASRGGAAVGVSRGNVDVHAEGFDKTPLGQAMRDAVTKWVKFTVDKLGSQPWEGRIVKADADDKVYINAGSTANIQAGDRFRVLREGEKLVDPATGLQLGAERTACGTIEVTQVQEKFAIAKAVDGHGFQRGDVLQEVK